MKKFNLDTRIEIYNEYEKGRALQELSRAYKMSFTNLRYMVKFIDRYGIENYIKPGLNWTPFLGHRNEVFFVNGWFSFNK